MSNLGLYQTMTTWAKKVGGPLPLLAITLVSGYVIFRPVEAGCKSALKHIKNYTASKGASISGIYTVHTNSSSNDNVQFVAGDQFRVLETADDAVLIEKIGDANNPYFLSADFLQAISDFKF